MDEDLIATIMAAVDRYAATRVRVVAAQQGADAGINSLEMVEQQESLSASQKDYIIKLLKGEI